MSAIFDKDVVDGFNSIILPPLFFIFCGIDAAGYTVAEVPITRMQSDLLA